MLPEGVDESFQDPVELWNAAESREPRKNSQVGKEMVLALPDDPELNLQDKIAMVGNFVMDNFVSKGLAAQFDIHKPHGKVDHNWHAHVLITTRRFKENGQSLGAKARDLDIGVRKGFFIDKSYWGEVWRDCQNDYFQEKGMNLQVDATGIVGQKHVGPVRMRGNMKRFSQEQESAISRNKELYESPDEIIGKIMKHHSIFTQTDIEKHLKRYVEPQRFDEIRSKIWAKDDIVELKIANNYSSSEISEISEKKLYTTLSVLKEEEKMMRIADRIHLKEGLKIGISPEQIEGIIESNGLNMGQSAAVQSVISGQRIACIEGRAGTGKSRLLATVGEIYEKSGYEVMGLSATSKAANVLQNEGIAKAKTLHEMLYAYRSDRLSLPNTGLFIVDEAGMVDNQTLQVFLQTAWKETWQVLMVGDSAQLPPVGRGGAFKEICRRYGSAKLSEIVRQEENNTKDGIKQNFTTSIAEGRISETLAQLRGNKCLHWGKDLGETMALLIGQWQADRIANPKDNLLIVEQRNEYIHILNQLAQRERLISEELKGNGYECELLQGRGMVYEGDKIQFRRNNKQLGIVNGEYGICTSIEENEIKVKTGDREISFNPQEFCWYQLGYAGTIYQAQGTTVDRAYVLHGENMNMNAFYVSMTRHRKSARYFVSKEDAKDMHELQNQISKETTKISTQEHGFKVKEAENRETKQPSFIKNLLKQAKNYLDDRFIENQEFYSYKKEELFEKYEVKEVNPQEMVYRKNDFNSIKRFQIDHTRFEKEKFIAREDRIMSLVKERMGNASGMRVTQEFFRVYREGKNELEEQLIRYEARNGFEAPQDHMERIKECIENSADLKENLKSRSLEAEVEKIVYENILEKRCQQAIWGIREEISINKNQEIQKQEEKEIAKEIVAVKEYIREEKQEEIEKENQKERDFER